MQQLFLWQLVHNFKAHITLQCKDLGNDNERFNSHRTLQTHTKYGIALQLVSTPLSIIKLSVAYSPHRQKTGQAFK